jgi:hypothetical protein
MYEVGYDRSQSNNEAYHELIVNTAVFHYNEVFLNASRLACTVNNVALDIFGSLLQDPNDQQKLCSERHILGTIKLTNNALSASETLANIVHYMATFLVKKCYHLPYIIWTLEQNIEVTNAKARAICACIEAEKSLMTMFPIRRCAP